MKIGVTYVYPVFGGAHDALAERFVASYAQFRPPGIPHAVIVVSNGGPPTPRMRAVMAAGGITPTWLEHDDSGWDIGAYRKAARDIPSDLMVFFGGSAYLRGARWLERVIESYQRHGRALYGATGSHVNGAHIRTTGFWMPPELLNAYPYATTSDRGSRYAFEHGPASLTRWVIGQGLKAWMVTWDGEYEPKSWPQIPNGFHRGDQSALIVFDRVTDPPNFQVARTQPPRPAKPTPKKSSGGSQAPQNRIYKGRRIFRGIRVVR
jgi:hypothetical protein